MASIGSLLNSSRQALNAQSTGIKIIGDNISNVNTPGYTRRRAELVTTQPEGIGNLQTGTGVAVNVITRIVDGFLTKEVRDRGSDRAQAEVRQEFLSRAEQIFSLASSDSGVGFELSRFFSSLEDVAANPSDIALRSQVIEHGESLALTINATYDQLATLQRESDTRLHSMVDNLNQLTGQIAEINGEIAKGETSDQQNLTLRDQRDELIRKLGEILPVQTLDQADRTTMVMLGNGFALVSGSDSRQLDYETNPTFAPVGGFQVGLDGSPLGHIVYDYDPNGVGSHADLTSLIRAGGGELGGLLAVRGTPGAADTSPFDADGSLVELAAQVESIARDLLTRFNTEYRGPDEDTVTANLQPSSFDLNGVSPGVFGLFSYSGAVDDGDGVATNADLTASGRSSFANVMSFAVSAPRDLAAARDLDPLDASTSFAPGDSANIDAMLALRTQNVAYSLGIFSATTTIEQVYQNAVSTVGGSASRANNDVQLAQARESQVQELYNGTSAVSLDEEFANLITYQRAFEAAARLVRVGDELLQQVLGILG